MLFTDNIRDCDRVTMVGGLQGESRAGSQTGVFCEKMLFDP